jgi:PAS domain S-box-containing protein
MTAGSVHALVRRYCLILAAIGVPMLLLVAGLAVARFQYERTIRLETFARDVADLQRAFDTFLQPAVDHVRQLRQAAEDQLSGRLAIVPSALRGAAATPREGVAGILYTRGDLLTARAQAMREIDMALGLFGPMRLGQLTAPQLHASYYISRRDDFFVAFPESRGRTFGSVAGEPVSGSTLTEADLAGGVTRWFAAGTGSWTSAAFDAQGSGWTVGYAADVRAAAGIAGAVATIIRLDALSGLLAARGDMPLQAWLVDDHDQVLAQSAGPLQRDRRSALAAMLPPALAALSLSNGEATLHRVGGWEIATRPLSAAPWHLVVVVNKGDITSLVLRRLWPVALLLGGLVVALFFAQVLMHRCFVGPAIALADRVRELGSADGEPGPSHRMLKLWRPWFTAVDAAFRSGHLALAQAREEQALKAAVVEAAFDAVITTDEAGRVVEFSPSAEAMFGYHRADTLGRPIADLIVPQHLRAAHVHGLRRYRETRERHMPVAPSKPRECVRTARYSRSNSPSPEVLLNDRRLFTATLRDITEAKQAATKLRTSAEELGVIDGIPIAVTRASWGDGDPVRQQPCAGSVRSLPGLFGRAGHRRLHADPEDRIRRATASWQPARWMGGGSSPP